MHVVEITTELYSKVPMMYFDLTGSVFSLGVCHELARAARGEAVLLQRLAADAGRGRRSGQTGARSVTVAVWGSLPPSCSAGQLTAWL